MSFWEVISVSSAVLLTILILVQTRGASLGAGLGGGGEVNTVRRGSDRTIFLITIIVAVIFGLSLLGGLITS